MHFKSKATNPYSRDDVHLLPDERPEAFSSIVLHLLANCFNFLFTGNTVNMKMKKKCCVL